MDRYFKVTPLGTVSPFCYDKCNCPGYLVEYGEHKVLLDCGNGITRLLKIPEDLNNLIIIISHLHKDHYGDILSLGYASYIAHNLGYLKDRIKVYIPEPDLYSGSVWCYDVFGNNKQFLDGKVPLTDYQFLMNFGDEQYLEFIIYDSSTELIYDDMKITFRNNPHQIKSHSIKIDNNSYSLVYSGDTGYKDNTLVELAKLADLLICESTFIKGQVRIGNNHLYAYEAGEIARQAHVGKLLLTHFYPYIDKNLYVAEAKEIFQNTEAAVEGKKLVLRR